MLNSHWLRIAALAALLMGIIGCGGAKKVAVVPETPTEATPQPMLQMGNVASIGGAPVQLTSGEMDNGLGTFDPAGTKIVFQSNRDGRWQVYEYNLTDSSVNRLITSDANDENPVWSPDSAGVIFVSDRNGGSHEWNRDIFFFDPVGGIDHQLSHL